MTKPSVAEHMKTALADIDSKDVDSRNLGWGHLKNVCRSQWGPVTEKDLNEATIKNLLQKLCDEKDGFTRKMAETTFMEIAYHPVIQKALRSILSQETVSSPIKEAARLAMNIQTPKP